MVAVCAQRSSRWDLCVNHWPNFTFVPAASNDALFCVVVACGQCFCNLAGTPFHHRRHCSVSLSSCGSCNADSQNQEDHCLSSEERCVP